MTEKYVKLSNVKDILAEAGLVTEYYDDEYESVSGYNVDDVNNGLAEIHTADVEPVRHAKWVELKNDPVFRKEYDDNRRVYYCSKCSRYITIDADVLSEYGNESLYEEFPYCHCGAKMSEEESK